MQKKPKISDEEKQEFRNAMRGVKPIVQPEKTYRTVYPAPKRKKPLLVEENHDTEYGFSDYETHEAVSGDELIEFSRSGIQHKMLRNLRQGQYNVEAILDLHGKKVDEARDALSHFLHRCKQDGLRHVLIIHGKGRSSHKPVLKNKLNNWLRQTEQVIAFCSAVPKQGHSGALYVLLRR